MAGYIVNTDPRWMWSVLSNHIENPVFWFRRENNPNRRAVRPGNHLFFRITGKPEIHAHGLITGITAVTVQEAFDQYGSRLGHDSVERMLEVSAEWTSSRSLGLHDRIFCIEASGIRVGQSLAMDRLWSLGISFDYQHIVTGKGIDDRQCDALLTAMATGKSFDMDQPEGPSRIAMSVERVIRDSNLVRTVKNLYENRCQVCGTTIETGRARYSEGHHIKPLGGNHRGPDTADNIIVLCPNHHAEFDYGWMAVDPDTMEICHVDPGNQYVGERLSQVAGHEIAREYLRYHMEHIFGKRMAEI